MQILCEIVKILSVIRKSSNNYQCHFTLLFAGFKKQSSQTQETTASRLVNIFDVMNLLFLLNRRVLINCLLSSKAVAVIKLSMKNVYDAGIFSQFCSPSAFNLSRKWDSVMDIILRNLRIFFIIFHPFPVIIIKERHTTPHQSTNFD